MAGSSTSMVQKCSLSCHIKSHVMNVVFILIANHFFRLQGKLELITGVFSDSMQLEVFDSSGSSVCSLDDDTATLGSLPIADGMKLHVSMDSVQPTHVCFCMRDHACLCTSR